MQIGLMFIYKKILDWLLYIWQYISRLNVLGWVTTLGMYGSWEQKLVIILAD